MALTYTPKIEIGKTLPDFDLPHVDGSNFSSRDIPNRHLACVMFICNHCPYVQAIEDRLIQLAHEMSDQPIQFIAICSNDPEDYPEDQPENLLKRFQEKSYPFPYLIDESQSVAKIFGAVCTPDIFVFDQERKLFYRGRLDDSWRNSSQVQRRELKEAIIQALKKQPPPQEQIPSMGCSIKWRNDSP